MNEVRKKERRKESRWDWFIDIVLFVPELLFYLGRGIIRGVVALFRYWN